MSEKQKNVDPKEREYTPEELKGLFRLRLLVRTHHIFAEMVRGVFRQMLSCLLLILIQ